eukprot:COSAG06_NODE_5467_length_3462_cov_4.554564_1_plen_980_part_00
MREKVGAVAALALLFAVVLLSASLNRAKDELNVSRSRWEEAHRQSEDTRRRLAALESALLLLPGQLDQAIVLDAAAPRGRALQDGECVSTSGAAELAVKTAFTVKEDLLALTTAVGEKAVAEDVTASLELKADQSELDTLTSTVGEKAVASQMTSELALKADTAAMDTALALKADTAAMDTALALKADQSELDSFSATVGEKAVASEMTTALAAKADVSELNSLVAQLGSVPAEVTPCRCAECADDPVGGDLCASFGPVTPCECEDSSSSTNPVRQTYPMTQSDPLCCREEWPPAPAVTQATTTSPQVFDEDDIMVRIGGQVTFDWTGFENVEQVSDFDSYTPISDGIRSGDPTTAGSFTHTFDTAGEYYFRSYVHDSLQVKVTVMDCVSCITVAGYEGAVPATLALALSSRAAGDFALAVGAAGTARVMTLVSVYYGQTLTLTGEVAPAGQLAIADVKADVMDGATLVVNAAYVSGGVAVAQRGTLQDNTGQVAATVSGMAVPKVVATPAIVDVAEACTVTLGTAEQEAAAATTCALSAAGASSAGSCSVSAGSGSCAYVAPATAAAVSSIDATADTVTLSVADSSIATGQLLQLIDRGGNTCAAAPKGQDLTVLSVNGLVISLSADITAGDASASSNCALGRAEAYTLPPCEAGDPPAIIYTHEPSLDMDVMMTCSEMGGEAAWRSVLTMGGVIFDGTDIAGFVGAIGSGLPGMYVLRLLGHAQSFVVADLVAIFPYQDVRVVSAATGDSTLDFTYHPLLTVKVAGQLSISGAIVLANLYLITATAASPSLNLGSVTFQHGVSVALADGTTPTVDGALPGTVALELGGSTLVSISRTADEDPVYSPANWALRVDDAYVYQGGWLYLLPLMSNPGGDNQAGVNWYIDACTAAGLRAVGCTSGDYATYSHYTQGGRPGGVNGWGSMSCQIDGWITANTGWSNFVHLEQVGNHLHGDYTVRYTNGYGSTNPVHPVCATPP